MKSVLLTGGSGFIGSNLIPRLAAGHDVVSISRAAGKPAAVPLRQLKGLFHSFEDLRQLDGLRIDTLVHLGAVTGGCSEEDGLAVNVAGTRRLVRYLLDRGCRRFILASSIAACGSLTASGEPFRPLGLPIADDHPFIGRDAYGLSKAMMEEVARCFSRAVPDSDFTCLRFGAVVDERTWDPPPVEAARLPPWGFILMGKVALADVLRGVMAVLDAPARPGCRVCNLVGPDNCCDVPVPAAIRALLGRRAEGLDLSPYERPGHEFDSLYGMTGMAQLFGFAPEVPVRRVAFLEWKRRRG